MSVRKDGMGLRCDSCGRYFRVGERGSSSMWVPDTYFTVEEQADWCSRCTKKHGRPPRPWQNVRVDKCSGYAS